ncbi:MAG: hypothetical protein ACI35S_04290 [Anaeroplasma sp.]
MKFKRTLYFIIVMILCFSLFSCSSNKKEDNLAKATFMLEGGALGSNDPTKITAVSYLYSVDNEDATTLIYDPNDIIEDEYGKINRQNYRIEGWYRSKSHDGVYSEKWDFANDRITKDGITLYAKWVYIPKYTYSIHYIDENNVDKLVHTYVTDVNKKFTDTLNKRKSVKGYTCIGLLDENGNKWDDDFVHPGGDDDTDVKVYLDLIKGDYAVVTTFSELKNNISKNIYLANDIDCAGEKLNWNTYNSIFNSYGSEFLGNGHTISNLKVMYSANRSYLSGNLLDENDSANYLYISVFNELNNATISNLNFVNLNLEIDNLYTATHEVVISPLSTKCYNSNLTNVSIDFNVSVTSNVDNAVGVVAINDRPACVIEETSVKDCSIEIKITDNRA